MTEERDDLRDRVLALGWCNCHGLEDGSKLRHALLAVLDVCGWGDFASGRQTEHIRAAIERALVEGGDEWGPWEPVETP